MVEYVGPTPETAAEPPVPPPPGQRGGVESQADASVKASAATARARTASRCNISRGERIWDIAATVVWISLAVSWRNVISILDQIGFPHEVPIPSIELVEAYYPWIVNVAMVGIAVSVLKVIVGRWNIAVGLAHTIYQALNGMLTVAMFNSGMLLRPETIASWAAASKAATETEIAAAVDLWGGIIGIAVTVALLIDIITRWVDVYRCSSRVHE